MARSLADLLLDAVDEDEARRPVARASRRTPPSDARSKNIGGKAGYGFSEYVNVGGGQHVPGIRYRPGNPGLTYPMRPRPQRPDSYQRT